jgi:hypothetical protein
MKKLHFAVMLMMSLVVISCSKEEPEIPVGMPTSPLELDLSSVGYTYERVNEDDEHCSHYVIYLPKTEAEVEIKSNRDEIVLEGLSLGYYYSHEYTPYLIIHNLLEMEGFQWLDDKQYLWEYKADFIQLASYSRNSLYCKLTAKHHPYQEYFTRLVIHSGGIEMAEVILIQCNDPNE